MKSSCVIAIFILGLTAVNAQTVNLNCRFLFYGSDYSCFLTSITLPDNPNANIVIGGTHALGRTNADVVRVDINAVSIPFIVTQLFTTFQNMTLFTIDVGNLTRIQTNAFANAGPFLRGVFIINNPFFSSIEANAFAGLNSLVDLNLNGNGLESVNENAFPGLNSLLSLNFASNRLAQVPVNLLSRLPQLRVIVFTNNALTSLPGRIFANNTLVNVIELNDNRIFSISSDGFLIGLNELRNIDLRNNVCVSESWGIGGAITINTVRTALTTCFNNDGTVPTITPPTTTTQQPGGDDLRRFVLELRGPLSLRFENGTQIVTV